MAPSEFTTTGSLITELFKRYKDSMQRIAYSILKDFYAADDTVQLAMIKIIENVHLIQDIDSRQCRNLVYAITKNTALDERRKKQAEIKKTVIKDPVEFANLVKDEVDFDAFDSDYNFSEEMKAYLSQLKELDKDIICLRYGNDFDDDKISQILGIRQDAVRKRLSRARQHLAAIIGETGNGSDE